jgi:DNA-binding transcriptional LysR family regulator
VHHLLQEGELVEVLPDWAYPPLDMHAVYPSRRFIPRRVRALVEHLAATLAHIPGMA